VLLLLTNFLFFLGLVYEFTLFSRVLDFSGLIKELRSISLLILEVFFPFNL
jgi:hypothetical protein